MNKRWETKSIVFFLLTCFLLEAMIVLASIGIWEWCIAAVYAVINACMALTIFNGYDWRKKLLLWGAMEVLQFLLCAIPLGLRAMF